MKEPASETHHFQRRRRSPAARAFADDDADSGAEKCGFVCHVLIVLLGVMYTAFVLKVNYFSSSDDNDVAPPRRHYWIRVVPTAIVCVFFAALLLSYVGIAFSSSSRLDALETIEDEYTTTKESLRVVQQEDDDTKSSGGGSEDDDEGISTICDLDVAVINDLVWEKHCCNMAPRGR